MTDSANSTSTTDSYLQELQARLVNKERTTYRSKQGRCLQISFAGFTDASNNIRDVLDSEYAGLSFDEAAANARLTVRFQHDSLNIHSTDCQTFKYVCGRCDDLPEGQHFEPEVEDVGRAA